MARAAIEVWANRLEAAYRADPWHAFRRNVDSARPEEWGVQPEKWTAGEFASDNLSIIHLTVHVGGSKIMHTNKAFGDGKMQWHTVPMPASWDMPTVLAWIDEGHQVLADGLAALTDDEQLAEMRETAWGAPMRRDVILGVIINHDIYHAGEINRQRGLIRNCEGWTRSP